ncbi:MAG: flagellar motor stator protein MotA, partial [Bryobacter sp.]|nr:flagellar motor stator protein MotA [Bryobacter sp.]
MFALIGIAIVIGAVVGGYLMEHGQLAVLFQPAELVIIGGAALGTLLIANPLHIIKGLVGGMISILKGSPYNKKFYLDALKMMNDIFMYARKNGLTKLESDVDEPDKSQLFSK